jgi:RNA polymerase sigma-70 factor (family 1)
MLSAERLARISISLGSCVKPEFQKAALSVKPLALSLNKLPYDEQLLLMQIARSDEKAFHALYQRYFPKVYAMSLHYMPDVFRAQDMVQEVFGRVWQHRHELQTIRHFEAWVITITRNLLINELRKLYPPGWQPQDTENTDPQKKLEYRELENLLKAAIGKLSARQREVYQLSRIEGFSHKEIARQLGISIDVSREHLSKALRNIRAFLLEEYGVAGMLAILTLLK